MLIVYFCKLLLKKIRVTLSEDLHPCWHGKYVAEVNEQKKKRVKVDSDVPRGGLPAIRNQLELPASLKGEQVTFIIRTFHDSNWFVLSN